MGRYLGWLVAILLLLVVFSGAGSAASRSGLTP